MPGRSLERTGLYRSRKLFDHLRPPEATRCSPVSHAESSDARKTAAEAISFGVPVRPRGGRLPGCAFQDLRRRAEPRCTASQLVDAGNGGGEIKAAFDFVLRRLADVLDDCCRRRSRGRRRRIEDSVCGLRGICHKSTKKRLMKFLSIQPSFIFLFCG